MTREQPRRAIIAHMDAEQTLGTGNPPETPRAAGENPAPKGGNKPPAHDHTSGRRVPGCPRCAHLLPDFRP